jgi:hypothetical protein
MSVRPAVDSTTAGELISVVGKAIALGRTAASAPWPPAEATPMVAVAVTAAARPAAIRMLRDSIAIASTSMC